MRCSRVSALLLLLAFVAAFVISAPGLVAEHAWDADATGGSSGTHSDDGSGYDGRDDRFRRNGQYWGAGRFRYNFLCFCFTAAGNELY